MFRLYIRILIFQKIINTHLHHHWIETKIIFNTIWVYISNYMSSIYSTVLIDSKKKTFHIHTWMLLGLPCLVKPPDTYPEQ